MPDAFVTSVLGPMEPRPGMPYRVVDRPFGPAGRTRPAKVFADGRPGEYLTDDEIAAHAHVLRLEGEVRGLRAENAILLTQLAARGAVTVEELVTPPSDGIEAATVTETTVPLSDGDMGAWISRTMGSASLFGPNRALVPEVGTAETVGTGCQVPDPFVPTAPGLEPAAPAAELVPVPAEPPLASEVSASEPVPTGPAGGQVAKTAKRVAVEAALKGSPHSSNAVLGDRCEVSAEFVRLTRKQLEAAGELEPVTTVIGRDGAEQSVATKSDAA